MDRRRRVGDSGDLCIAIPAGLSLVKGRPFRFETPCGVQIRGEGGPGGHGSVIAL